MLNITNIPAPRVNLIDQRTGMMAREWYRFFLSLFELTGAGGNATSLDDLQMMPVIQPPVNEYSSGVVPNYELIQQLDILPPLQLGTLSSYNIDVSPSVGTVVIGNGNSITTTATGVSGQVLTSSGTSAPTWTTITDKSTLPSGITVTASPFIYTNSTAYEASVVVTGGTVSLIEFSRDGVTYYPVGTVAGMFTLSASDKLRVTYIVAPTMTHIPR